MNVGLVNRVALKTLGRNKMRSVLAILGISIGIGAVVTMVAVGAGASNRIRTQIASYGANVIWIEAGSANRQGVRTGLLGTKTLVWGDLEAIRSQIPTVTNVSPQVDTGVQIKYGNQNWRSRAVGVSPEYLEAKQWAVIDGTSLTDEHSLMIANVCVLGQTVRERLFNDEDPIGKTIRVSNLACQVLGVLARKGAAVTGQDQDDLLLMPYTTVQKKIKGQTWLDDIVCSATSAQVLTAAEEEITQLLRQRHRITPPAADDFNLRHPVEIYESVAASTKTLNILLASIAAISLLVGGIGIMNIMLVSVTERTREIGIRMAVGAKGLDIVSQFLWEALLLCFCGGAFGMVLGIGAVAISPQVMGWPARISLDSAALALGFAGAIGLFFGFYPVYAASRLDTVDALRHEM